MTNEEIIKEFLDKMNGNTWPAWWHRDFGIEDKVDMLASVVKVLLEDSPSK